MRNAWVLFKGEAAGLLSQHDDSSFTFRYLDAWMADSSKPPISLTLPKTQQEHHAISLFPCFYSLLPEGTNKQVVCKLNRIDQDDHFGILLVTATGDNIGAISLQIPSYP